MCEICEQYEDRLHELLNLEDEITVDSGCYLLQTQCTASGPCVPAEMPYSFFLRKEDFLEAIHLLPHVFGSISNNCANLTAVRDQAGDILARYQDGQLTTAQAMEALNIELAPTDIGIVSMGSFEEYCTSDEAMFAEFRADARFDLDEQEDEVDCGPFSDEEKEKFVQWINHGEGGMGEDFSLADEWPEEEETYESKQPVQPRPVEAPQVSSPEEYFPLLFNALVEGDRISSAAIVEAALKAGVKGEDLKQKAIFPAYQEAKRLMDEGEYFIPELMICSAAIELCIDKIEKITGCAVPSKGTVVLGMPKKDFVQDYICYKSELAFNGYEVIDLGEASGDVFAQAVCESGAKVVFIAIMLQGAKISDILAGLTRTGLRDQVKVMILVRPGVNKGAVILSGADAVSDSITGALEFANQVYGVG